MSVRFYTYFRIFKKQISFLYFKAQLWTLGNGGENYDESAGNGQEEDGNGQEEDGNGQEEDENDQDNEQVDNSALAYINSF